VTIDACWLSSRVRTGSYLLHRALKAAEEDTDGTPSARQVNAAKLWRARYYFFNRCDNNAPFGRLFILKTIVLPRQVRDKRRQRLNKKRFFFNRWGATLQKCLAYTSASQTSTAVVNALGTSYLSHRHNIASAFSILRVERSVQEANRCALPRHTRDSFEASKDTLPLMAMAAAAAVVVAGAGDFTEEHYWMYAGVSTTIGVLFSVLLANKCTLGKGAPTCRYVIT
jgi:ElaB/YqjD/DUF883 family membrane-anchored ribosome-binding protein